MAIASGVLLLAAVPGCSPPQIGPDRAAFKEVDALFTAVSMRDAALVTKSEARLKELRDAGKLPPTAADRLAAIIAQTQNGQWEPAQDALRDFMLGQQGSR